MVDIKNSSYKRLTITVCNRERKSCWIVALLRLDCPPLLYGVVIVRYLTGFVNSTLENKIQKRLLIHVAISVKGNGGVNNRGHSGIFSSSPKRTLVFLKGFVNEHVSLHFVLPIERGLTQSALVWFFTWKNTSGITSHSWNTDVQQK